MAYGPRDRKAELVRRGLTLERVAAAVGCTDALVSRVVNAFNLTGPVAHKVMVYIAEQLGEPVEVVFPEVEPVVTYRRKELVG